MAKTVIFHGDLSLTRQPVSNLSPGGGFFRRLKHWAAACTRRGKLALHFPSLVQFASVIDWVR